MSDGMPCPACGHTKSRISDSRLSSEIGQIRRRRRCYGCGTRWTTFEIPAKTFNEMIDDLQALRDACETVLGKVYNPAKSRGALARLMTLEERVRTKTQELVQ